VARRSQNRAAAGPAAPRLAAARSALSRAAAAQAAGEGLKLAKAEKTAKVGVVLRFWGAEFAKCLIPPNFPVAAPPWRRSVGRKPPGSFAVRREKRTSETRRLDSKAERKRIEGSHPGTGMGLWRYLYVIFLLLVCILY
jgi:hypothetical protein